MDPLDFAVYRYLSRDGEARFWAGRRVIDPRITPREVARSVLLSESGVRARIQRLNRLGYLRDRLVVPNPSLFGRGTFLASLPIQHPGEVEPLLADLGLVEGVVFARDLLDESQRRLEVFFVSEGEQAARRVGGLLGRLTPSHAPVPVRPYYVPPCIRELTALQWRVLHAVWLHPNSTFAQIAHNLDISLKTAGRVYRQLLDSYACWWTEGADSEEFPLALVRVTLTGPEAGAEVTSAVAREAPQWMPVAPDGMGIDPKEPAPVLEGSVPADVPAAVERLLRKLGKADGVASVHRSFVLGSAAYPAWFGEQFSQRVRARSPWHVAGAAR